MSPFRRLLAALLLVCAPLMAQAASAAPGFTGRWVLDLPASDFGKGHKPPRAREDQVVLAGVWVDVHSLTVRASGDTSRLDYRYRTDGDAVNKLMGQEMRTHGRLDGTALRFESVAQVFMMKLGVNERWSLSADGGSLTIERDSDSPLGKEHQRLVFRRRADP